MCVPLWAVIVVGWTVETLGGGIYLYARGQAPQLLSVLAARISELLITFCLVTYNRRLFAQDEKLDREFQPWLWMKYCVALIVPALSWAFLVASVVPEISWSGITSAAWDEIAALMWVSLANLMLKSYVCMIICGRKGTLWVDESWDDSHTIDYAWTYCRTRPPASLREWMHQRNPCCQPRRHTIYGIPNPELREKYQVSDEIWDTYLEMATIVRQLRE